jgi:nucleoside-diphosphate-sugar epimerase
VFGPDAPKDKCPQEAALNPITVYGISKLAGEQWCDYYHRRYGLDVRSLRYPGLINYKVNPVRNNGLRRKYFPRREKRNSLGLFSQLTQPAADDVNGGRDPRDHRTRGSASGKQQDQDIL